MPAEEIKLLPCPFCGEEPQIVEIKYQGCSSVEFYDIACECGLSIGKQEDLDDLIEQWNRRRATLAEGTCQHSTNTAMDKIADQICEFYSTQGYLKKSDVEFLAGIEQQLRHA